MLSRLRAVGADLQCSQQIRHEHRVERRTELGGGVVIRQGSGGRLRRTPGGDD